jgi:serine/threonine-protein kinase HipA
MPRGALSWEPLDNHALDALLTAYRSDIPLGMVNEHDDFRISVAGAGENRAAENRRAVVYPDGYHADHPHH